jgi:hypothetical protein
MVVLGDLNDGPEAATTQVLTDRLVASREAPRMRRWRTAPSNGPTLWILSDCST